MYPADAVGRTTHWQLRLKRAGWAAISRVLAAGLPQRSDELPVGTGARRILRRVHKILHDSLHQQLMLCCH